MSWFFIALLSPVLHAAANHIDKYLLSRYFKGGGTATLIIFSSIFGLVVLPFIVLIEPNVLDITPSHALLLLLSGIIYTVYLIPYFYALNQDEASIVVPLFQTVPIFGYILAYFVLGETLNNQQIFASLLIISGAVFLSLDLNQKRLTIKKNIFLAMLLSSFLVALGALIFKFVAIQETFWVSSFWNYIGYAIVGSFLLTFIKSYRKQFLKVIHRNKLSILTVNSFNEILFIIGALGMTFASLLAPLALVLVVDGLQPFFVLVYGIIITLFLPKLGEESLLKKDLIQKIIAILLLV